MQTVSISYLRCLIEHVRCYILDRDIELIYYTIRKSSDVLTRDPMQLGAQVIEFAAILTFFDHDLVTDKRVFIHLHLFTYKFITLTHNNTSMHAPLTS